MLLKRQGTKSAQWLHTHKRWNTSSKKAERTVNVIQQVSLLAPPMFVYRLVAQYWLTKSSH